MRSLEDRISDFDELGKFLRLFCQKSKENSPLDHPWGPLMEEALIQAEQHNGWFLREQVLHALEQWGDLLDRDSLTQWTNPYPLADGQSKTIGLVMAGNIPLVGFHDLLCVLISGNKAIVRQSSNDKILLPVLMRFLGEVNAYWKSKVVFTDDRLDQFDAVIATGSNNTARYFEHYFGKKPNIIRKNRNTVAVLTGVESQEELEALGEDIFRYYGLGCRSVSKLFVPKGYDFDAFFKAMFRFAPIIDQQKYANNYDYNKAVYLMSEFKLLENGFLMLKEDPSYASPIASLFYEYYDNLDTLAQKLEADRELIQCVVGKLDVTQGVAFGQTQQPSLTDYADGVDTLAFLQEIQQSA